MRVLGDNLLITRQIRNDEFGTNVNSKKQILTLIKTNTLVYLN